MDDVAREIHAALLIGIDPRAFERPLGIQAIDHPVDAADGSVAVADIGDAAHHWAVLGVVKQDAVPRVMPAQTVRVVRRLGIHRHPLMPKRALNAVAFFKEGHPARKANLLDFPRQVKCQVPPVHVPPYAA